MQKDVVTLKEKLINAPVLVYPNLDDLLFAETDSSGKAVGDVLAQKMGDGKVHAVHFASREMNYA